MLKQNKQQSRHKNSWFEKVIQVIFSILGLGVLVSFIVRFIRQWRTQHNPKSLDTDAFTFSHQGLSSAEVDKRRTDEVFQAHLLAEKAARKERWRKNAFSIFNVTILVLAISQILLEDPLGAFLTIGVLVLSISINIFQETRAAKKVGTLARRTRPMATVIREGKLQSITEDEIVVGDVLVAGGGDEILANGVMLESANLKITDPKFVKDGDSAIKETGDDLIAGTYCTSGWVVYQVSSLNIKVSEKEDPNNLVASIRYKTPLQKIIERVLFVLLGIVAVFYIFFFLEVTRIDLLPPELMSSYREVMSIIFSILPGGLMLMIVINYAVGSADIARSEVLVHNSQTIESLAQVSTIGFIRHGGALGLTIDLEMFPLPEDAKLSERRVRLALGNYVHSIPGEKYPLTIIKTHLDGEPRSIHQQARYLSLYGWEAMTFSSVDMPGSYVIGYPKALKPYLLRTDLSNTEKGFDGLNQIPSEGLKGQLRKFFGREKLEKENSIEKTSGSPANLEAEGDSAEDYLEELNLSGENGILKGLGRRLAGVFRRKEKQESEQETDFLEDTDVIESLIFAYSPAKQPIYDDDYYPKCPKDLLPLCVIKFINEVRPDVKQAVKAFKEEGISIKIISEGDPENSLALANQLGLEDITEKDSLAMIGDNNNQISNEDLKGKAREKSVFSQMNSEQMVNLIQALKNNGEHVAVFGTSINDLDVMKAANLSITKKGSSPTVLDQADLIMLKNSFSTLTEALQKGQGIVNSVMDVLKLNLSRIGYIFILILVMYILGERTFFYHPAQGGIVNFFTVLMPSIALSLWPSPKTVESKTMSRLLFHFISVSSIITALAVLTVHFLFTWFGAGIFYAQLAVTHTLVVIGLMLVLFAQPPVRFLVAGDDFSGNWKPALAALVLYVIFNLLTIIPLAQRWFRLGPLHSLYDYLLIYLITIIWGILVVIFWRLLWPDRFRPNPSERIRSLIGQIRK